MENIGEDADRPETEPSDPVLRASPRCRGYDDDDGVIRPSFPPPGPGPVSPPTPSLPPAAAAPSVIAAGDQSRAPPISGSVTRLRPYYSWVPGNVSPPPWQCQVCPALFAAVDALATHFHQYHLNPHHLCHEDRRKYRLSNFLVNTNEEAEYKTEFPGLYRCHECFNVFSFPVSLREHLLTHLQPPAMVMSKMPSKFSREDFEDVSPPRKRSRRSYKENDFEEDEVIGKPEKINNNLNGNKRVRTRVKNSKRITEINSDPSDEYNSDSDFDGDKISVEKQRAERSFRSSKPRRVSSKRFSLNGFSEVDYTKAFLDPDEELDFEKKAKKTKARNVKRSSTKNRKQSKLKQNEDTSPSGVQINGHEIKDTPMKTKEVAVARRSQKQEKKWRFKIIDHSKHHSVVKHLTTPASDFICLSCNQSFSSYIRLSQHRKICDKNKKSLWINNDVVSKLHQNVKEEMVSSSSEEFFQYVTGAVTTIPETTFNNMHGKIVDLNTEDAQKLSRNHLNEIGLVKLNFSGNWSVKDVWESGCWEPKEDQLTWQDYELSSEIFKSKKDSPGLSDKDKTEADKAAPEPDNDEVHKLTENLTTQIVGRKAPIITNLAMDRQMVLAMSNMHWTEQKYVKQRIDTNLTAKRNKRLSVGGESIRQSNITSILDLKQTGKSVKYMKQVERESLTKPVTGEEEVRVEGSLSGEWELGHSYMCSVCGVEYDDMMEILHHKWEAHPRCLVSHFSVRDNVTKPTDLMYPQVGPSKVKREAENETNSSTVSLKCSKCQMEFTKNEDFYHHILECGGVEDLVESKKKKKKKRGMGGGLKSTVRMLKQADKEGTDTGDEQSPRKKPRPPQKVVQPVPLIPTHTRTTRYKETMKKEAKKIAAKERRIKKKGKRKSKEELQEQRKIVAEVLDKILSDVEKIRRKSSKIRVKSKPSIPREEAVQLNSKKKEPVQLNNIKRDRSKPNPRTSEPKFPSGIRRKRREAKVKTYKEDSDSEPNTEHREDEQSENLDTVIESEALATPKTVLVTVVNDEILSTLTDIDKIREEPDTVSNVETPSPIGGKISEDSPRILKRLVSTLVSDAQVTALGSGVEEQAKHRSRQQFSVETKMTAISRIEAGERQVDIARDLDIGVPMLESWWIRKSDIKTSYVNKLANGLHDDEFSGKKSPHKAKSLSLKTIPVSVKAGAIESVSLGKSPSKVAREIGVSPSQVSFWIRRKDKIIKRNNKISERDLNINDASDEKTETTKKSYSLQFKKRVIERISSGEDISTVAKKLKIRENTVSVWWVRRDQILRRQDELIPNINPIVEPKDIITEAPSLNPKQMDPVIEFTNEPSNIDLIKRKTDIEENGNFKDTVNDLKETVPEEEESEKKERQPRSRRSVSSGAWASGTVVSSRWCMPIEVKQTALRRLEAGLTQAVVARDLGVSLSTVASWWRKKDSILGVTNIGSEDLLNSASESNSNSSEGQDNNPSHVQAHSPETNTPDEIDEEAMSSPTKEPTSQIDDLGILELEQLMTDESEAEMKSAEEDSTRNINPEDDDEAGSADPKESEKQEEMSESDEEKNSDLDDDDSRLPEALSLTPRPRSVTSMISQTSTPRPQSGLHLIVSSYCSSSEDEL